MKTSLVFDFLEELKRSIFLNKEDREQMGMDAMLWVKKYFIEEPLKELVATIEK